ncbi:3-dehydroquinate synthase [hydrothermal vent metagenome]|uniref:3-dehydroquinate synthase n=1 Tax=hydrothermal vent metagenome TaxID=652676 RepID=A0A3B1BBD6_9ZZZZ
MTQKITVSLESHSYDILVGEGLLDQAGALIAPLLPRLKTVVITDENVAKHQLPRLEKSLVSANIEFDTIIMPAGEASKSFHHLEHLLDQLLSLKLERNDIIVAFGGGVIGDLVGFAASIYMRGIDFIQIPTTLLAQVDSSVGGKTGINSSRGKNLVGSFHQPCLVLTDVSSLNSLPKRQLLAGYAEVVKYGLIDDATFFSWLEKNGQKIISGDPEARREAIVKSCQAKARVVAEDEKERGNRALLNLGHTFGHALEAEAGYSDLLFHGEAVAIGMVMAFNLSVKMGLCSKEDAERLQQHLEEMSLPTRISKTDHPISQVKMTAERLYGHVLQDKKKSDGRVNFVIVSGIGKAFLSNDINPEDVKKIFLSALQGNNN